MSINFNLREPFGNKCTNIYAVIRVDGKQIKIPTGLKINSWLWDKKKQIPIIYNNMTVEDKENAILVFNKIYELRFLYQKNFMYICNERFVNKLSLKFKNLISMKTKKQQTIQSQFKASKILKKAFEVKHGKELSLYAKKERGRVQAYIDYMKDVRKCDGINMFEQIEIDDYCAYLKDLKTMGAENINHRCQTIVRLINDVVCARSEFREYGIKNVTYKRQKDSRRADEDKKRALTSEEIKAVLCNGELTEKEKMYRDIFELQLESGVRVSDLGKILNRDCEVMDEDGKKLYKVMTEKEGIPAFVIVNDRIKEIQEKYEGGVKIVESDYNKFLKSIFLKSGLTKEEKYYMDVSGKKKAQAARLCDIISSHWARHTFITNKLREGYEPGKLCHMTGHADDKMIKGIYSHLTDEDKARIVTKEEKRVHEIRDNAPIPQTTNNAGEELTELEGLKNVLFCLGASRDDLIDITDPYELYDMIWNDYHQKYQEMGCDMKRIKDLYRDREISSWKKKRELIQKVINEVRNKSKRDFV